MERRCYFCRKPLPIEKRAEMFCSLRCQELQRQMSGDASAPRKPVPPGRRAPGPSNPSRPPGRRSG